METRREALVKVGLAKPGRGKFSKEALAWLDDARKNGVKFSDDDAPAKVQKSTGEKPVRQKVQKEEIPEYISPSDYRFPEGEYVAWYREDGKKVYLGMRECCECGYSFLNHPCDNPTKYGKVVTIEAVRKVAA